MRTFAKWYDVALTIGLVEATVTDQLKLSSNRGVIVKSVCLNTFFYDNDNNKLINSGECFMSIDPPFASTVADAETEPRVAGVKFLVDSKKEVNTNIPLQPSQRLNVVVQANLLAALAVECVCKVGVVINYEELVGVA